VKIGIHTTSSLTIRRFGEIDRTNDISLLRRWWNTLPVAWFDTETILSEIGQIINKEENRHLIEVSKLIAYNKILIVEALYLGIYNLIVLKPQNDQWKVTRHTDTNLLDYLQKVEKITGIKIKGLKDLERLDKEGKRLQDKYVERFPIDKDTQLYNEGLIDFKELSKRKKQIPFTTFAYAMFENIEMDYDPETTMLEFASIIERVKERQKALEKMKMKAKK